MKQLLLLLLLLASCAPRQPFSEPAQAEAYKLFVEIGCDLAVVGTGFPVASDLVMTAAHVGCYEDQVLSVSLDRGQTWREDVEWFENSQFDVGIVILPEEVFADSDLARFREPALGEVVSGYGIPFGGLMSFGRVARVEPTYAYYDSVPFPGMSGSAVVGADRRVVGLINHAWPAPNGALLAGGLSGNILQDLLDSFLAFRTQLGD